MTTMMTASTGMTVCQWSRPSNVQAYVQQAAMDTLIGKVVEAYP